MIYVITFLLSCTVFLLSEKSHSKYLKRILVIVAILLPCFLAAIRHNTIGTDVKVYVEPLYNAARESDNFATFMQQRWFVVWRYMYVNQFEIGFSTMIFLIEKLGGSLKTVLFFIQLLIITPVYLGLKKINKPYPIYFGMCVFYFIFYNTSLNMMRQWIAMSILFLGFSYLVADEKKRYFVYIVVGTLFHTSALFGVIIFVIYQFCQKQRISIRVNNFKLKEEIIPIKFFIYGCVALLSLNVIVVLLDKIGLGKYVNYIQGSSSIYILPGQIFIRLPIIVLFVIRWKRMLREDKLMPFYGVMIVLDLLSSQLQSVNPYAFRIGSFFAEYNMLIYPAIVYTGNSKYRSNRYLTLICVLAYIIFYWTYYYVVLGTHATVPYMFA